MKATSVFISYAHRDAAGLAIRLHESLSSVGWEIWLDKARLKAGAVWSKDIEEALDRSEVVLALLSAASYVSEVCRGEQLRALRHGKCVIPILVHADADRPVYLEARHFFDFSRNYEDVFPELLQAIRLRRGANLSDHYRYTGYDTVPPLPLTYLSREDMLTPLLNSLLSEGLARPPVGVTGLRGMGGIGKTVLAEALCRDERIHAAFPDGIAWVTIGRNPGDLLAQMRTIARALGESTSSFETLEDASNRLRALLWSKAALIVLDDVWDAAHVEPFRAEAPRARLLFTTRDARVAAALGAAECCVDLPSFHEACQLLARYANLLPVDMPPPADDLVEECGRLPLALSMVGALLRNRSPDRWTNVLDALRRAELGAVGLQFPNYPYPDLLRCIKVSVDAHSPEVIERYHSLAVFPEDVPIPDTVFEVLWRCSTLEAQNTTDRLVETSLAAYDNQNRLVLHDLQHDFVRQSVGETGLIRLHEKLLNGYSGLCSNGWPTGPNDGYFFQQLRYHLVRAGRSDELVGLLLDLNWLESKSTKGLVFDLLLDFTEAKNAFPACQPRQHLLSLLEEALRRDVHFIARHTSDYPQAMFQCLWNTAWWFDCPEAVEHYELLEGGSVGPELLYPRESGQLCELMFHWYQNRSKEVPSFAWIRNLRPPPLPLGAGKRLILRGHESDVTCFAFSPDGRFLATGSIDQTVRLWNTKSGELLEVISGLDDYVMCVMFSVDGDSLVWTCGEVIQIWSTRTGEIVSSLHGYHGHGRKVALFPDGKRIATCAVNDYRICIVNLNTSELQVELTPGGNGPGASVAVSPDGRLLAGSLSPSISVWDMESGAKLAEFEAHGGAVSALSFSREGQFLMSAGWDNMVKLWTVPGFDLYRVLEGHKSTVTAAEFSLDGKNIVSSGGHERSIRVWDVRTGQTVRLLREHDGFVFKAAFSPDGNLVGSSSADGSVSLLDWRNPSSHPTLRGHRDSDIDWIRFTSDGRRLITSVGLCVVVWDTQSLRPIREMFCRSGAPAPIALSANDSKLATSWNEEVSVWNMLTGENITHFKGQEKDIVVNLAFSPDGATLAAACGWSGETLLFINSDTGELLTTIKKCGPLASLAYSPDGERVVVGCRNGMVRVWDVRTAQLVATFTAVVGVTYAICVSGDNRHIAGVSREEHQWSNRDHKTFVLDATTGECLSVVAGKGDIYALTSSSARYCGFSQELDMVIRENATLRQVAWFSSPLRHLTGHPFEPIWAGSLGEHVYFIRLEETRTQSDQSNRSTGL